MWVCPDCNRLYGHDEGVPCGKSAVQPLVRHCLSPNGCATGEACANCAETMRELIREVMRGHADDREANYNDCEMVTCRWCQIAATVA